MSTKGKDRGYGEGEPREAEEMRAQPGTLKEPPTRSGVGAPPAESGRGAPQQATKPRQERLVQGDGSRARGKPFNPVEPHLFVVRDGQRHAIEDFRSFREAGYDQSAVEIIPDAELEKLPLAPTALLAPGQQIVLDLDSFLGAGHYMTTWGVLRRTDWGGHVDATTRTRTITMFGGFRGGVNMVYADAQGFPVGMSPTQSFGVDGTWIGRSDRTDYWSHDLTADEANRTTSLTIFHFWNPWSLQDQVAKLVAAVKPILEIVQIIVQMGGQAKTGK